MNDLNTVINQIIKTSRKVARGEKLKQLENDQLARAGISEGMARRIAEQSTGNGVKRFGFGFVEVSRTENWTDTEAIEAFRNALRTLANTWPSVGVFKRKPSHEFEKDFIKQANQATQVLVNPMYYQSFIPLRGNKSITVDLTKETNRSDIREEVTRIVKEYELKNMRESEILDYCILPLAEDNEIPIIKEAAIYLVLAINNVNCITRAYFEGYPEYKPLYDMVDQLAKQCCPGAAQMIGNNLPGEVSETWPYFARVFEDAKKNTIWLWPDIE